MNPNWQAAMVLLDSPSLLDRVERYCDPSTERISPQVLKVPWSTTEANMICLAVSLTSSRHKVCLYSAFDGLDDGNIARVTRALSIAAGGMSRQPSPQQQRSPMVEAQLDL